ncbi:acyltransferase domain-containing protein [Streptomyces blattellae]|uniref:acyltransferase domain-containing protein n=1 Tax=Streptomyces blattellae TaxID=2569855 RepID=UPI0038B61EA1
MLFGGQGSPYRGMARPLYDRFAVVRDVLDECERFYKEAGGTSLLDPLLDTSATETGTVWETSTAQPALFAVGPGHRLLRTSGPRSRPLRRRTRTREHVGPRHRARHRSRKCPQWDAPPVAPPHTHIKAQVSHRRGTGLRALWAAAAELHCLGLLSDPVRLLEGSTGRRIPLPRYPFQHARHWSGPELVVPSPPALPRRPPRTACRARPIDRTRRTT